MSPDFSGIYQVIGMLFPLECMQPRFMRQAMLGLLILSPMTAMLGVHVLNFRMAFFSDAVGHSAFAGLALGILLGTPPALAMPVFGVITGLAIMIVRRRSGISADAAIGIVFSAVVAFGLAVVSRAPSLARDIQQYLYGDILTISENEIIIMAILLFCIAIFEIVGWNKLLMLALSPTLAQVDGVATALWQYLFAGLLALVVMFSVRAVGVLLVTALLVVPAACGRKLAKNMRGLFWWSIVVAISSAAVGLPLSAMEWPGTASGATVILIACLWYACACAGVKLFSRVGETAPATDTTA